jgi:hypothetical protein
MTVQSDFYDVPCFNPTADPNTKQHDATLSLKFQHHPTAEAAIILSLATHFTCSVEISLGLATIPNNYTVTLYRQLTMSNTQQQETHRIEKRECQIFVKILAISTSLLVFHPIRSINPFNQSIQSINPFNQSTSINPFQSIRSIPINPFPSNQSVPFQSIRSIPINPPHSIHSIQSTPLHRKRHDHSHP